VKIIRQVGVINQIFPEQHTISILFVVKPLNLNIKLNSEHKGFKWVSKLSQNSHTYLKR